MEILVTFLSVIFKKLEREDVNPFGTHITVSATVL
jgi:hypothetical protein